MRIRDLTGKRAYQPLKKVLIEPATSDATTGQEPAATLTVPQILLALGEL